MLYLQALLMLLLKAVGNVIGCKIFSMADFSRLPDTGFICMYHPNDDARIPFVSYWDVMSTEEVDAGLADGTRAVYLKPVSLEYFRQLPTAPPARRQLEALCDYFDQSMTAAFRAAEQATHTSVLAAAPVRGVLTLEFALLDAKPARRFKNIMLRSARWSIPVLGMLVGLALTRKADLGYVAMGVRIVDDEGNLVGEIADFEYGLESVVGKLFFDSKSAGVFAYQRATIDRWAHSLARLCTTPCSVNIKRTSVTWLPF